MVKLKGKIRKIGNSYGILLQKAFFDQQFLKEGQEVTIDAELQQNIYKLLSSYYPQNNWALNSA